MSLCFCFFQGCSCWLSWCQHLSLTFWTKMQSPQRRRSPKACTISLCRIWCGSAPSTPPPSRRWSVRRPSSKSVWNLPFEPTRPAAKPKPRPDKLSRRCRRRPPSNWKPASSERSSNAPHTLKLIYLFCVFLMNEAWTSSEGNDVNILKTFECLL